MCVIYKLCNFNFSCSIINGQPKLMGLKELLQVKLHLILGPYASTFQP